MSLLLVGVVVLAALAGLGRLVARTAGRQRAARSHHRALGTLGEVTSRSAAVRPAGTDTPYPSSAHVRLVGADHVASPTTPAPLYGRPRVAPPIADPVPAPILPPKRVSAVRGRVRSAPRRRPARHGFPALRSALIAAAAVAVVVGGAAALLGGGGHPSRAPHRLRATAPVPTATVPTAAPVAPPPTLPPAPTLVSASGGVFSYRVTEPANVVIRAARACWMEIRAGSGTGGVVFVGTLGAGQTQDATGPLWLRLGDPAAAAISVDGTSLPPPPGAGGAPYDLVFE